jgi:hypothetical protein
MTLEWLMEKLPVLVFVVVAIFQIGRAVLKSRTAQAEHEEEFDESSEQRRGREIQERLRRTIAARRGQTEGAPGPLTEPDELPPVIAAETMPIPADSVDGPFKRRQATFERDVAPVPAPTLARPAIEQRNAELERQSQLAEQMRQLAETRELVRRRAVHVAADAAATARSDTARRIVSRANLLGDLRRPESLRRAIVLREVLGPPVGLR